MDFDRRAAKILEAAEKQLAALAAEAMQSREYQHASALMTMAQNLAVKSGDRSQPPIAIPGHSVDTASHPVSKMASAHQSPSFAEPALERRSKTIKSAYPRFKREGDMLVKIGWSKTDRATYEHRSPQTVITQLVARIIEIGSGNSRFTTEQVLPLMDMQGASFPDYQVYLCLAWLVSEGLISRYGRQGYSYSADDLAALVKSKWDQLSRH